MKTTNNFLTVMLVFLYALVFSACSSDSGKSARVTINTGICASKGSVTKAPALSSISSVLFYVTGEGMEAISESLPLSSTSVTADAGSDILVSYGSDGIAVSLDMEPGSGRTFSVTVNIKPSDPGVVLAWSGSETVDVVEGENVVQVVMGIRETKILVPDYLNNRVVQIDDMADDQTDEFTGDDAVALNIDGAAFSAPSLFQPSDIEIDSLGRIYIANGYDSAGAPKLIRMDSIYSTSADVIVGDTLGIISTSIDTDNNYIYYATSSAIRRINLDGTNDVQVNTNNIGESYFRGIAVDGNGYIYIANEGSFEVIKIDLSNGNIATSYTVTDTPWDVLVRPPYVYVANFDSAVTGSTLIRLDSNLTTGSAISLHLSPDETDYFYGPHRFLAILNRRLYIMDDGYLSGVSPFNIDRIVTIDDIDGINWQTFGSYGTGNGQFEFFEHYNC